MAIAPPIDNYNRAVLKHGDTVRLERVTGFYVINSYNIVLFLFKGRFIIPNTLEISKFTPCRRVITEKINVKLNLEWGGWITSSINYPPTNINYNPLFPL